MFGSYGSYSSMSSITEPLDVAPSSYLSRTTSFQASCAYPSWPQRSSLTFSAQEERATSYLSDDDLFPCNDLTEEVPDFTPSASPSVTSPFVTQEEMLAMRREQQMAMQQQAMQELSAEKERRKQVRKASKRGASYSKSSRPKTKHADE